MLKIPNNSSVRINLKDKNNSQDVKRDSSTEYDLIPDPPDGGYGWVILFAAVLQTFICQSSVASLGIFAVEFIEYFDTSTSSVSWIGSILFFMIIPAGLCIPPLLQRFGSRKVVIISALLQSGSHILTSMAPNIQFLFFSIGILVGISSNAIALSGNVILQSYFHKKRARALSIASCGGPVALFFWPPMTRFFIYTYTWRGANILLAGLILNCLVCGSLLRPAPVKRIPKMSTVVDAHLRQERGHCASFCRKNFTQIMMFAGWFGIHAGHVLAVVFTPIRANVLGLSRTQGALLLSVFGIVGGLSRLVAGVIGDLRFINRHGLVGGCGIFCGLLSVVSISFKTFSILMIYCVLFGIGSGFYIGLHGACIYDVVGLKHIARGYAIICCAIGLSNIASLSTAGYLYDLTGSPTATVASVGIVQALGGIWLCFIPAVQAYQSKTESRYM